MSTPLQFKTLPNLITGFRIILIPLVVYGISQGAHTASLLWLLVALAGLIVGELTDFLDGTIARRMGTVSNVGKLIDPMSDSLFRMCVFITFLSVGWADLWMVCLIFARDIVVAYLRVFTALQQVVLAARQSGKIKAIAQAVCQIGVILFACMHVGGVDQAWFGTNFSTLLSSSDVSEIKGLTNGGFAELAWWFSAMATVVTVWSGVDYCSSVIQRVGVE